MKNGLKMYKTMIALRQAEATPKALKKEFKVTNTIEIQGERHSKHVVSN